MAYEGAGGKDERVRVFLRQCMSRSFSFCRFIDAVLNHAVANQDKTLLPGPTSQNEPPHVLKGYLNKYTNMAKGYGTRWFVLKDGVLSCQFQFVQPVRRCLTRSIDYRHQDDETVASRGSISMKTAVLRQSDRTRFEVHPYR